jgi:hypothetical protein
MSAPGFAPDWPAPPGVRAWVTTRPGGASRGAYAALNLATHVGDDGAQVVTNRRWLVGALGLPSEPVWLNQVHGTAIAALDGGAVPAAADGAVTSRPGTVCAVLTADCLPVLLAARDGRRIGVAHAGWRGLAAGVLGAAVAALGTAPADVVAWLGPAIGPAAYEVGAEVRASFADSPAAAACLQPNDRGRWQADLYGLARLRLAAAGVHAVYGGGLCTFTDPARFFSHRREAPCGRMATLIWRA